MLYRSPQPKFIQIAYHSLSLSPPFEVDKTLWVDELFRKKLVDFMKSHGFQMVNKAKFRLKFVNSQTKEILSLNYFHMEGILRVKNSVSFIESIYRAIYNTGTAQLDVISSIRIQRQFYYFSEEAYRAYLEKTKHLIVEKIEDELRKLPKSSRPTDLDRTKCLVSILKPYNEEILPIYWQYLEECIEGYLEKTLVLS